MTLKGAECVRDADVLIYDYLVGEEILGWARPGCERIYVGKRGGAGAAATQEEINSMLLREAKAGKVVVRLKGGDPFVLGRGGEEAEVLGADHIPFEIVPGVTSAVAVPAYAGIPVTHRSLASSFCVVTGHEDPDKSASAIPWEALARTGGTLVFLMGVKRLPEITGNLVEAGMPPGTPAALIRWGCTPRQRTLVGDLRDIAGKSSEAGVRPPAVLVVGDVVSLQDKLAWFERRPLMGKTVLVTRAAEQAGRLSRALSARGATPVELPVIAFAPPDDVAALDSAIGGIGGYDWLLFTSVNGVRWLLKRVRELGGDVRSLAGPRIAAIGPATQKAVEARGISVEGIPSTYVAEDFVRYLSEAGVRGKRVLVARAQEARSVLIDGLARLGASVDEAACYKTVAAESDVEEAALMLTSGRVDMVTFTSSSTVTRALELLREKAAGDALLQAPAACIGPVTARTASREGLKVSVVAEEYTVDGLVDAMVSYYNRQGEGNAVPNS